jgi:hypothetical protein
MKELEKALGWFDRFQADASEIAARVSKISAQVSANTYDPKEALGDWVFFVAKGWLSWLPEPTFPDLPNVFIKYSKSIDGAKDAVGFRRLRATAPAGAPTVPAAPQGPGGATIPIGNVVPARFNQDTDLLVTAKSLSGQVQGDYTGKVQVTGVDVATLLIRVTA